MLRKCAIATCVSVVLVTVCMNLSALHFFSKAARYAPADAIAGRQRFGNGTEQCSTHPSVSKLLHAFARTMPAEIQFTINIIFDQRNLVAG
jgi:hypothetical protein